jgi:two-component system chemotaxis sensor kinase CheA
MNLDEALQTFILEAQELLADMEAALLSLEEVPDPEKVNAIFRAAHTIKGSAGLFGLDHVVAFTHVVESILDEVRAGHKAIDPALVSNLLHCGDHITALVAELAAGRLDPDPDLETAGELVLNQLTGKSATLPTACAAGTVERMDDKFGDSDVWHISLRFSADVLRLGMDPLSFLRYLGKIGRIVGVVTMHDSMPPAGAMDPETCYLGFEIAFASSASKTDIESVFEFVADDCVLHILPPHSRVAEYLRLIDEMPADAARLGDMLVACGTLTAQELNQALQAQKQSAAPTPIGAILVEQGNVEPTVVEAALARQKQAVDQKAAEQRSIRVDADKLDHLINLVGELIIAGSGIGMAARRARNTEVAEASSHLTGLVEQVRDATLQLRMVKIGATFNRFQRVVHDVARELGKDIHLVVSGEETELDKTVVEKIADPLTHLIRNALDHGIEPASARLAAGKPAQGTVYLDAHHDGGHILIEVHDDGGGLKRDRILAKAIERGLVEAGRTMSDREIFNLIFEPGFSTAEQITNLSGRGVGMDVVKRNITDLRGTVDVDSVEGVGTTVSVRLPLTLAIIDGFLVEVGGSSFVIPLEAIDECIEHATEPGQRFATLRGKLLPLVQLRDVFAIGGTAPRRENIVVVQAGGRRVGLVVDNLLGEFQTVIKPLARMFSRVSCIGGSTILGSGDVALILDVPAVLRHASNTPVALEAR